MRNGDVDHYCLAKPGSYVDLPFGPVPICYKVCGRIFLELYPNADNHKVTVSCEPALAELLRGQYPDVVIPGYHCPARLRPSRNTVYLNQAVDDAAVFRMIDRSYERVASRLPRRVREKIV